MASEQSSQGSRFGIRTPPLLDYLQGILRGYSDGQILKELLQNAEDAGATVVQFLYDENHYGENRLLHPRLKDFQGPALCSYNNAVFTEQDWKAIQTPSRSGKKNNVLKVGRFGIGFSSVYHLTDLPCIISKQYLAMIDPFERYFSDEESRRSSGCKWDLKDILHNQDHEDQLQPIKEAHPLGTGFGDQDNFAGTIFRFPLRNAANKLSSSVYTQTSTLELLDAFQEDASIVLLFLRNIESIEIFHKLEHSKESKSYLKAYIDHIGLPELRSSRKTFCSSLQEVRKTSNFDSDIPMTTNFDIITENENVSVTEKWVVHQEIVFDCSEKIKELLQNLKFLPWVGVAIPMFQQDVSCGRTFCFLPLPAGDESKSGLPVHVHGFFGVSDDRRSLKWPGGDQIQNEEAEWNKLIVDDILPQVYRKALLRATQVSTEFNIDPDVVYAAFPDARKDLSHWSTAVQRLYSDLFKHPMLYCHSKDQWMAVQDVLIPPQSLLQTPQQQKVVVKCLQLHGQSVIVNLPDHIRDALEKFCPEANFVSAQVVIDCIQGQTFDDFSQQERLYLLMYLFESECLAKHLRGLPLIPTDLGSFVPFVDRPSSSDIVFMDTPSCPRGLLPNMRRRFLLRKENVHLIHLWDFFDDMARSDSWKQFKYITAGDIVRLLPTSLPKWWSDSGSKDGDWCPSARNQPNREWLQQIWQFISNQRIDLLQLQGLKLFPVSELKREPIKMMALMNSCKIIQRPTKEDLPSNYLQIQKVLETLGVIICTLPRFVSSYHHLFEASFVHTFTPTGVLKVLHLVDPRLIEKVLSDKNVQELFVSILLPYISGATFTTTDIKLLKQLPLFFEDQDVCDNPAQLISLDDSQMIIKSETKNCIPKIRLDKVFIQISNADVLYLVQKLGFEPECFEDLLRHILHNAKEKKYSSIEIQILFDWVKAKYNKIRFIKDVCDLLCKIRFVPNEKHVLKRPNEVFDTCDDLIKLLILETECLPLQSFLVNWRDILLDLGLKTRLHITTDQVRKAAENVIAHKDQKQAGALLEYLCAFPECLSKNKHFCTFMKSVPFLTCLKHPPVNYSESMPFYDESGSLLEPRNVLIYTEKTCHLVGAVKPLVDNISDKSVIRLLDIPLKPHVEDVISQLKLCVSVPSSECPITTLHHIYAFLNDLASSNKRIVQKFPEKWIYVEDQFVEPNRVYRESEIGTLDLRPFLCVLPRELRNYESLLSAAGIPAKVETDVNRMLQVLHELNDTECEYKVGPKRKLAISIDILRRLQELPDDVLEDEAVQRQLLIPSRCTPIKLLPPDQVCYCDADWLIQGMTAEDLQLEDDEDPIYLVNDVISPYMAERFGVVPLSQRLAGADEVGGIKQTGQFEALTVRLKNILRNGYQPEAIPKEMVQNAEDAGASEVRFLLDLRKNDNKMKRLLDPAMEDVQGPALWVYNDATFTDADLENITKLGGGTKSEDGSKIGQFGLGFNAVYHITDVPSFVTKDVITFFDPHKSYLKRHIRGNGSGIQLNFLSSSLRMRRFQDQFLPYEGIFGCHLIGDDDMKPEAFQGTLFRLPLRNENSALRSDICPESYSEGNMKPLVKHLCDSAINMILFTERVSSISVYLWEDNAQDKSLMYKVDRTTITGNNLFKDSVHTCMKRSKDMPSDAVIEMTFSSTWSAKGIAYFDLGEAKYKAKEKWIKVASAGKGQAHKLSTSKRGKASGLLPCGGVAWNPSKLSGNVFCFLPLSVPPSNLPVYINGSFAVSADRRHLWRADGSLESASAHFKAKWNNAVCHDVVVSAYITLLKEKKVREYESGLMNPFSLWPNSNDTSSKGDYGKVVTGFYEVVAMGRSCETPPKIFFKNHLFLSLQELTFGEELIQNDEAMFGVFEKVVGQITNKIVLKLPVWVKKGFKEAGCEHIIQNLTYSWATFFSDVVFPNIELLAASDMNNLIVFALSLRDKTVLDLMTRYACIPCDSRVGVIYKYPSDLLDVDTFKEMFSHDEEVFPASLFLQNLDSHQLETLRKIGSMRKYLSGEEIVQRAKTVQSFWKIQEEPAMKRVNALLNYIGKQIRNPTFEQKFSSLRKQLKQIAFLPAMRGDGDVVLESANNIYPSDKKPLIGEVCFILSDMSGIIKVSQAVSTFLDIKGKRVKFKDVSENVQILQRLHRQGELQIHQEQWISLYKYLQKHLEDPEVLEFIRHEKCFLIGSNFVDSCKLSRNSESFPPYLYQTPYHLEQFDELLDAANVKIRFNANDFILALKCLKEDQKEEELDNDMLATVLTKVIKPLFDIADEIPPEAKADIPLPNSHKILRPSGSLCFCDLEQFQHLLSSQKYDRSHNEIPLNHAKRLGVKDVRQKMLNSYSHALPGCSEGLGEKFGQREELVNRIKRIMEGYPCDFAILKELVQNADDAKATVVHFVLDCRRHPDGRVFYDAMKGLQGPALLAYNDRPFSEEDIEGIQKLGEGSKGDATDKTGRYGVGFNVVYHLTDCPMFLSKMDTLCVFDPTLKFIKDATANSPGRMFRPVNEEMIDSYADIFNCFLSFEAVRGRGALEEGSLFRFPLRTKRSVLGGQKSVADVKFLLQQFQIEMFDSLLFLKSVREISISVIEPNGVSSTYTVKADYSNDTAGERKMFFRNLSQHAKSLDLDVRELNYVTKINDNNGKSEEWLVHQRLGVESKDDIPKSVRHANSYMDLKLIPKGGVAARLNATSPALQQTREIKAMSFCFLPLPVFTNLPVHVDGYFALGHEARRNLWQAPEGDARSDWNYLLAKDVICCSYVRVIETLKDRIIRSYEQDKNIDILKQKLAYYHSFFPLYPRYKEGHRRSALEEICHAFYTKIALDESTLFPVIFDDNLRWCSCIHLAKEKGYFYDIHCKFDERQQQDLRQLLLNLGFPILESPLEICRAMKIALEGNLESTVLEISPQSVVTFLKNGANEGSIFAIPTMLQSTVIGNTYRLGLLLEYILLLPDVSLNGIPLLLTNDGVLREFENDCPVFHSRFFPLLPKCSDEFLHKAFLDMIPSSDECFKVMQLTDVADRLHSYLPKAKFCQDEYILLDNKLPTIDWLQMLWIFLDEMILDQRSTDNDVVTTLGNWCIFPACNKDNRYLVPMKLAKTVLSTKKTSFHTEMRRILRDMNCPSVDTKAVVETKGFCIRFSSELDNIGDILLVLERQLRIDPDCYETLQDGDHVSILRYFSTGILKLEDESRNIIRRLPCFESISGNHTALSKQAYAVSMTDIPESDQDKWVHKCSALLLKKSKIPQEVLQALEIEDLSDEELYERFVLPYFESFSLKARWGHLNKLMKMVRADEHPEVVVLSLNLSSTPIVTHNDGTLKMAKFFHDDENPVFKEMSEEDMFPPKHPDSFRQHLWIDFLREIGLQTEVSQNQFENFVTTVSRDENGNRARVETLINYLFQSHHLHDNAWFLRVASIPFITAANVDDRHSELHEQCQTKKVALFAVSEEHRNLVWSVEPLLPVWVKNSSCATCGDVLNQTMSKTKEPTIKQVLLHTKTLFVSLKSSEKGQNPTLPPAMKHKRLLDEIITEILGFLSRKCLRAETCGNCADKSNCCDNCQLVSEALDDVAIVPVGNGACFKAKRMTKNLTLKENDKLFLFLREIPDFLMPQKSLLYCLGATETPSLLQYATVLWLIEKEKDNLTKNPPLYLAAKQAIDGFFICLSDADSKEINTVHLLFLLSTDKKRPIMESNSLYYNDEVTFGRRLSGFQHPLMKRINPEEVDIKSRFPEVLNKLGTLRPKLVSENVKEIEVPSTHVPENVIGYDCTCVLSEQLRTVFSWSTFVRAVKGILTHEGIKDLSVHEESLQTSFTVCCLSDIQTQLHLKDEGVIPESKADSGVLFAKGEENDVTLYLSHNANQALIHVQIAERFFRCLQIPLENTGNFEAILKAKSDDDMFYILSRLRINITDGELEELIHAPELGSDIEEDVICLLEENPLTDFNPGEFVGYNKTESTTEHFVYAKVIRRVYSRAAEVDCNCWQFSVRYVIDIGEEKEVAAIWLYNFPRPDDSDDIPEVTTSSSTSVELYNECKASTRPMPRFDEFNDLHKTKQKITEAIEALWKEEEIIRKTGLRRLMRQWHPDKHKPANKAFAEEVFKHIRNEIERLEKGKPSGVDTANDIWKWAQRNNTQQQRYWRNHERRHGQRRSRGGSRNWRQWQSRSFFTPPSFRRDNDEARRWQKQARIDLQAASSLKDPFFQWSCCLCFLAVEKSVRAAQLVCGCNVNERHRLIDAAGELKRHLDIVPLITKLVQIVKEKSHYPSSCASPSIPHDVYTRDNSIETIGITKEVLRKVDGYLEGI